MMSRNMDWLPPAQPLPRTKHATWVCALTGNGTGNLSVHRTALQPTEPHQPGQFYPFFHFVSVSPGFLGQCMNSSGNRKYLHSFLILIEYFKCFTINFEMCSKISLDAPKETFVLSDCKGFLL
uniref:Uncharacterized protein n=1 Tax=Myotis myotis TaxID=51298 RepID=A0A7J7SRV1_MYOMY|nr:hypothetical protein mMyoMyo1_009437 [Myotis myotis]